MTKDKVKVIPLETPDAPTTNKSEGSNNKLHLGKRLHFLWLVLVLFGMSLMIIMSTYSQYLVSRFIKEVNQEWNVTHTVTSGGNHSTVSENIMLEAQARASTVKIYASLVSGFPSLLTIFLLGAFSDRVGRKMLFLLPCCGFFAMSACYAIVSYWNLAIYYIYIGHFVEGALGSFVTMLIGAFAFTSDTTKGDNSRSLGITAVEAVMVLSLGITEVALGQVIHNWGYTIPFLVSSFLLCANAAVVKWALPESHSPSTKKRLNVKHYFHSTFHFYYSKKNNNPRSLYLISGGIFLVLTFVVLGKPSVDILFMLNSPLNWDSRKIGYYGVAHRASVGVGSLVLVGGLQRWFSDSKIGFISTLSVIAGAVVQAFAWDALLMYTAVGVGCFSTAGVAMVRSTLSKLTPQGQHGAMFGGIAMIEAAMMLANGTVFTAIYRATLSVFHGAVFLAMAGTLCIASILFIVLDVSMRRTKKNSEVFVLSVKPEKSIQMRETKTPEVVIQRFKQQEVID